MGSDFSELDAELEALASGTVPDALALAEHYAAELGALADVDEALEALSMDVPPSPFSMRGGDFSSSGASSRPPASEEIMLPEPMTALVREEVSGEIPVPGSAPRSGSFALQVQPDEDEVDEMAPVDEMPPVDELAPEQLDSEALQVDEEPQAGEALFTPAEAQFELDARGADANRESEADSAFAELFAEATSQSSMPSGPHGSAPPSRESDAPGPALLAPQEDDTDIFDTRALGLEEEAAAEGLRTEALEADEIDSAEFELVADAEDALPAAASSRPTPRSERPEKRPSFLDRLFGRKED